MYPIKLVCLLISLSIVLAACGVKTPRPTPGPSQKPGTKPNPTQPAPTKPGDKPSVPTYPKPTEPVPSPPDPVLKETYRIALVMPFLTGQFSAISSETPEKSKLALQYYGGMQIALEQLAASRAYPNFVVDILDEQTTDAEFKTVLTQPRLTQAQVVIGPVRNSHLSMAAANAKISRQIIVSPESPAGELTTQTPGFIQINPSLRAHCARIIQHLRAEKKYTSDQIVLVAKQKEADRLPYLQEANRALGGAALREVIVPDASINFEKIDLKKMLQYGKTTAFVMPSWAGQDWIVAFLGRLKSIKGAHSVEVYGMPQWLDYEQIEPELLRELNVHVTAAAFIDRENEQVQAFEQAFYDKFGVIPEDDAFNGYDVTLFTAEMLKKYGLSFPEKAVEKGGLFNTLRGGIYLRKVQSTTGAPANAETPVGYDYAENIFVHILRFDRYDFIKI